MPPVDRKQLKGGTRGDSGRSERLAAELRENLKRRKARERTLAEKSEGNPPPSGTRERDD